MPSAILGIFLEQMPALEAQESLAAIDRLAIGTGSADPDAAADQVARWRSWLPRVREPEQERPKLTKEELTSRARASGIAVVIEEPHGG